MSHHFRISLPTKPYLQKYLHQVYGTQDHKGCHILINSHDILGIVILTTLSSNLPTKMDKNDIDVRMSRFTQSVTLKVPMDWWYRLGQKASFNNQQIIHINRYFENEFEQSLHQVVTRASVWLGIEKQFALESFANNHGIELDKDISFEGLKKMEYRFRKASPGAEETERNIVAGLSSQIALF